MTEKKEQFERRKKVLYDMICDKQYIPMKIKEIAILLNVPKDSREELRKVLDALVLDGKIELTAKGKYRKASAKFLEGTFIAHPRGFGFVEVDGRESDIFIPEEATADAMHRDTVQVAILQSKEGKRQEGKIVKILEHGIRELIGTYQCRPSAHYGFLLPDNKRITKDIFIAQENAGGAMDGHKVLVELLSYGGHGKSPEGRVKEIIGHINDPGTDIMSVVYEYGLPFEFSDRVMKQAERTPACVSEADMQARRDLRDVVMVTIDGEDAKDLDDAVSLSFDGTYYYLGVHIADVSNYVQENSALDCEARTRGTSVYLADRVIPMLPHRLSNGICSLNAGVDRLAMSCLMQIDCKGNVIDHEVTESVIRVDRRMSYTQVKEILEYASYLRTEQDGSQKEQDTFWKEPCVFYQECRAIIPMLEKMEELMRILRVKRKKRGAIDFNFPEAKVLLDENGVPMEIVPQEPNTATRIIEEFMLCANETVAEHFFWQETPFLYRTHEAPDSEKIEQLASFIAGFGYGMKGISDEVHPKELQKLLARTADTPQELLISRLTLRSMKQARYTTEDTGHFGLAAQHYCHFTSPIRRYPDLQIHRIIKDVLRGRLREEKTQHYTEILPDIAEHCSKTERRADEAERDTVKMKKAQYMMSHIGEEYDAVITGLMSYGMYAELPNTVEGLIHVTRMYDDRYYYREESYEMYGMDTGRIFRLGDTIRIRVTDADKEAKTVDFELAE
ncbi:MAG: ribonuclease R [Lachnospiraceae bacterium]|nr:ribonuclease R [Lachnospiraceae bacterium]